jgi:predicted RNA-binding protein with PIN domain
MFLIDGNNLMAQRVGWHKDKQAARRGLLDELADFAKGKSARVQVVFDGAPERFFGDGARYRGVQVFYARAGNNADERIKEIVEASRERRTLFVVTSDRALADYVRRCGAQIVSARDFRQRMVEVSDERRGRDEEARIGDEPRGRVRAGELDEWMRYFGVDATDED